MNRRQRRVFNLLRTKTKAIGLNRKELESLALKIDKNLELEEDASDEEIDEAAGAAIDSALPFLEVSQSVAQRSIQTTLQRMRDQQDTDVDVEDPDDDGQGDDDDDDGSRSTHSNRQRGKSKNNRNARKQEDSALMKLIKEQSDAIKSLKGQIDSLQGDRVTETRRTKLKNLIKNTGTFGKSVMKQFNFMTFKDEDAFEDYLAEVQQDLDDLNQERANEGLRKLGEVPAGEKKNPENQNQPEVMSDADIIALAGVTPQQTTQTK